MVDEALRAAMISASAALVELREMRQQMAEDRIRIADLERHHRELQDREFAHDHRRTFAGRDA